MDLAGLPPYAALAIAFAAGTVSFLSPCVAPLVPGYLAFIAGVDAERQQAVRRTLAFVAGFALVFTLLGLGAASITEALLANRGEIEVGSGLLVALLGLAMVWGRTLVPGSGRIVERLREPGSYAGAVGIGAAFAFAWSPCIGPALAAILTIAGTGQQPAWGGLLLFAYSAGLGLPFIAAAFGLDRFLRTSRALRAHARGVQLAGGAGLVLMGIFIASGQLGRLTAHLARWIPAL